MISIPKLEMHVTDACNLRCTGCTHYADHGLRGTLELDTGRAWVTGWGRRVTPVRFSLLGGEPLLHPELAGFLAVVRQTWPRTELRLVSNALLLPRHPELWPALASSGAVLTISRHSGDAGYLARFAPALRLAESRAAEFGVRLEVRDCVRGWYKLYLGVGPQMRPHATQDPRRSWSACQTKHCLTLRDNALWKCPPIAHLPSVAARHGLDPDGPWQPYLSYRPLELAADDEAIRRFVARQDEPICRMCPAEPRTFAKSISGDPAPW